MFSAKPKHFLTALLFSLLVQVVSVTPAVAASAVYDCLFNWAESAYANLFAPRGATSTSFGPAYYRYYAQTNSYIGVSLTNSHLYYIGVLSANSLLDVGAVSAWYTQAGCSNVPPIATAPPTTLSAADLQGTWVVTWDSSNNPLPEIVITATGQNTFTGTYNPPYAGRIEGTINGSTITVRQLYNDGRLYGTYTFNNNSSSSLRGSLVDYLTSYNNVEWQKRSTQTTLSAADLQGTWVVTWDSGNNPLPEIVITATGQNTFTGTYNPPYAGRIEGTINGSTITVRQLYNDGRLYGTYTFNNNSSSSLRGSLVDYLTSYNNVEWTKR